MPFTTGLNEIIMKDDFLSSFSKARSFCRDWFDELRGAYNGPELESELRKSAAQNHAMPQSVRNGGKYLQTGSRICPDSRKKQQRNGSADSSESDAGDAAEEADSEEDVDDDASAERTGADEADQEEPDDQPEGGGGADEEGTDADVQESLFFEQTPAGWDAVEADAYGPKPAFDPRSEASDIVIDSESPGQNRGHCTDENIADKEASPSVLAASTSCSDPGHSSQPVPVSTATVSESPALATQETREKVPAVGAGPFLEARILQDIKMRHDIFGGAESTGKNSHEWARSLLDAQRKAVFKGAFVQALMDTYAWKDTAVSSIKKGRRVNGIQTVVSAQLTRLDNVSFNLVKNSGVCFYIMANDDGLELIDVFNIIEKNGVIKAVYWRVLSTRQAIQDCPSNKDVTDSGTRLNGALVPVCLRGRAFLRQMQRIQEQDTSARRKFVFHRGDNALEVAASCIVGVVASMTDGANRDPDSRSSDDTLLRDLKRTVLPSITSLDGIDVVIAGDWFVDDKCPAEPESSEVLCHSEERSSGTRKRKERMDAEMSKRQADTPSTGAWRRSTRNTHALDDDDDDVPIFARGKALR